MLRLLITDFDGTLVDTFEANYRAYRQAFADCGLTLTADDYRRCFGLRFDDFMRDMGVADPSTKQLIRERKAQYYPLHFDCLTPHLPLLTFLRAFRRGGGQTAVASTAHRKNLENALTHIGAVEAFDLILAGEEVEHGKPSPEIYYKVLAH